MAVIGEMDVFTVNKDKQYEVVDRKSRQSIEKINKDVNNSDKDVTAGKVWKSTSEGAGWADSDSMSDNQSGGVDITINGVKRTLQKQNETSDSMADNENGGVDITIGGTKKTVAKQADLKEIEKSQNELKGDIIHYAKVENEILYLYNDIEMTKEILHVAIPASSGGGGSNVMVTTVLESGEHIATIEVDGVPYKFYAPSGGGSVTNVNNTYHVTGVQEHDYRINSILLDNDIEFIEGVRINNGVESSNASYFATNYIPIDRMIDLDSFFTSMYTNDLFLYDADRAYVCKVSDAMSTPENAKYFRISSQITLHKSIFSQYGQIPGYQLLKYYKQFPKENGSFALANNVNLVDIITDPQQPDITINFYGDSNTYGYGVDQKSWAYYIAQSIKTNFQGTMKYYVGSPHIQSWCGINTQAAPYPALKGLTIGTSVSLPYIRIRTTAKSVKVGWTGSGGGLVVIDDDFDNAQEVSNGDSITLDGNLHTVDLKPEIANIMNYNPYFEIEKTITCNNYGATGRASNNVKVNDIGTCDLAFVMIGTNDANNEIYTGNSNYFLLNAITEPSKVIGILPPANRSNQTLMRNVLHMKQLYDVIGVRTIKIPYFNELIAFNSDLMQSDGLHYSTKGHMALANGITSECGIVCNIWDGGTYDTEVTDVFANLATT